MKDQIRPIAKLRDNVARGIASLGLLAVMFSLGVSWHDLRNVHNPRDLKRALQLMPVRLDAAVMRVAHADEADYSPYQIYADVLTTLRENYYGKSIDTTQMTYNAIRGMMGSLKDRYTRFMDPEKYKEFSEDNTGQFVGIGAQLNTNAAGQTYVVRVLPGGPALRYRVMAGDVILKVDNKSTLKMKDTEVVKLIRGAPNTKVTLTLLRKSPSRVVKITIPREIVQQEVVQSSIIDDGKNKIGYIQLTVFDEESDVQLEKALTSLQAHNVKGLILDMRENPGGLLDIAQRVASRFVPSGPIVWIQDRTGPKQSLNVLQDLHENHLHYPLVVLVNSNSASAAEIVSGAIKDTNSGVLVGVKTFGKGLVQTIIPLHDGSAVAITTQHYYTAKMHDINHKGIEPDITVRYTDTDQRKVYTFFRAHPEAFYDMKDDTQLQRALVELRQRIKVASVAPW